MTRDEISEAWDILAELPAYGRDSWRKNQKKLKGIGIFLLTMMCSLKRLMM